MSSYNIRSLKASSKKYSWKVKSKSCSNWGDRQLSEAQIHYAACDALVLLRLYDAICFEIIDLTNGLNISHLYDYINTDIDRNATVDELTNIIRIKRDIANTNVM